MSHCHCDDCRQATGAALTTFVGYQARQVQFEEAVPAEYSHRPGAARLFCRDCGTPIGYRDARLAHELYFYLGVMAAPERFQPEYHAFVDQALPWLGLDDDLPRYSRFSRSRN
ncbi:MAG TPA: GFA family protein [Salinisphaera sp.]|nr:GFA family protein [Salinisphaera sp.]